jgi:PKD repeat protein
MQGGASRPARPPRRPECRSGDTATIAEGIVAAAVPPEHGGMSRLHRILILGALATGVLAPNASAAGFIPTAVLETSAQPVFNQGYFQTPAGTRVYFSAAHSDPGTGSITKVEFDLNGNGIYDYTSSNPIPSAQWTYAAPARDVTVRLRVTNSFGIKNAKTLRLRVNTPPEAAFQIDPLTPMAGEPVTVDAAPSTDDESGLSYAWDPEGDGSYETVTPAERRTLTFATPGPHTVGLLVYDRFGLVDTTTRTVEVLPRDETGPALTISSAARLTGKSVTLEVDCPADEKRCTGDLTLARSGRARFPGSGHFGILGGSSQTVTVPANKRARKRIRRTGLTTVATAIAEDAYANTSTTTQSVTITR